MKSRLIDFCLLTASEAFPKRPGLAATYPVAQRAQVAELVDALASGASDRKVVEVRVLSWAPPLN